MRIGSKSSWSDVLLFSLFLGLTVLIWVLFLGWRPGYSLFRGDMLQYAYPYLYTLKAQGLASAQLAYDPALIGGSKPSAAWINPVFMRLLLGTGLATIDIISGFLLVFQVVFGFLSVKFVQLLLSVQRQTEKKEYNAPSYFFYLRSAAFYLLVVFAPFLGWRVESGHLLYSLWIFPAFACLYLGLVTRGMSYFTFLLSAFALWNGLQTITFFILFYAILCLIPLAITLFYLLPKPSLRDGIRFSVFSLFIAVASVPYVMDALKHFTSSDASRSIHDSSMIYAYSITSWRDWLASIPWFQNTFQIPSPKELQHETTYSFGPLLLFLLFFLKKKLRIFFLVFFIGALLSISLADNIHPISDALLTLMPLFSSMRVPSRVGVLLDISLLAMALVAMALIMRREKKVSNYYMIIYLLIVPCFFSLIYAETISWIVAISILASIVFKKLHLPITHFVFLLSLVGLFSFKDKLSPPLDMTKVEIRASTLQQAIYKSFPELTNPLMRAEFNFKDEKFFNNTAYVLGVSSLSGYSQLSSRFVQLVMALIDVPYNPQVMNLRMVDQPSFDPLYFLYNVKYFLSLNEKGVLFSTREKKETAGIAWLPKKIKVLPSYSSLSQEWHAAIERNSQELKDTAYLLSDDPLFKSKEQLLQSESCSNRRLESAHLIDRWFKAEATLSPGRESCLLVFSMNFAENLIAVDVNSGENLLTLPVNGSMFAVFVPEATQRVQIHSISYGL